MSSAADPARLASLDQFRGYTVLGMFFVNFAGSFLAIDAIFRHNHTYCSYADTIMPQFFFAVGFAYRLTFVRRVQTHGSGAAWGRAVRRNLGLILLGVVWYRLGGGVSTWAQLEALTTEQFLLAFKREPFQTLTHIGVTALWILPVIGAPPWVRVAFACASGGLFVVLSDSFYYKWVMSPPVGIDGGPLGFLTWTIPMIVGSLACDAYLRGGPLPAGKFLAWGVGIMAVGYGLSCLNLLGTGDYLLEPPFVPPTRPVDLWTMSQRAGSVSYLTFGAGFSLALYAIFVFVCDRARWRLGVFDTLGQNALAAYLIHTVVSRAVKAYVPRDAPLWYVLAAFLLFFAICYVFLRHLEKQRLYLRL